MPALWPPEVRRNVISASVKRWDRGSFTVRCCWYYVGAGTVSLLAQFCFSRSGRRQQRRSFSMCDYSLQTVRSRPAKVGEKLKTRHFNTGTIGFAAPEDCNTAVCVLPGTELAFATPVRCSGCGLFAWKPKVLVQWSWRYLPTTRDMNQTCVTWRRRERLSRTGALLGTLAGDTWPPAPPIWRNRD